MVEKAEKIMNNILNDEIINSLKEKIALLKAEKQEL
jgi:hypothetical protein